jgi:tyrosyl-tRNA synthetase
LTLKAYPPPEPEKKQKKVKSKGTRYPGAKPEDAKDAKDTKDGELKDPAPKALVDLTKENVELEK